jgi:hypothetical protein
MPLPSGAANVLLPWNEVGARTGLTRIQAKKIGDEALAKIGRALKEACLDKDWLRNEFDVCGLDEERYLSILLLSIAERKTDD